MAGFFVCVGVVAGAQVMDSVEAGAQATAQKHFTAVSRSSRPRWR